VPAPTDTPAPSDSSTGTDEPLLADPSTNTDAPSDPPPALSFAEVRATDDEVGASTDQITLDVLENDSFGQFPTISAVTQPANGTVEIVDNQVLVTLPPSFGGDITFDYTLTDESGAESTATVTVFSVNVLAPAGDRVDADEPAAESITEVFGRCATLFTGLVQIRLSTVQLSVLAAGPLLFGVLRFLFVRREDLVSVTSTPRNRSVDVGSTAGIFKLRHDALMWSTQKTRKLPNGTSKTRVELPNGELTWIDSHLVTDTGF